MSMLIPDTNFLIYLVKYKLLDELSDYNLIIINQIKEELQELSKDKETTTEDRNAALISLQFLKTKNVRIEKQEGNTDDSILKVAKRLGAKIGTMDKELTIKAKENRIGIIKIRQKKYLQ